MEYTIWRSCERFGIRPPDVEVKWEDNSVWIIAKLIAFEEIRQYEEFENLTIGLEKKKI